MYKNNAYDNTTTSRKIVQYMKQIIGHTTIKNALPV
jgi:hypothetical protein